MKSWSRPWGWAAQFGVAGGSGGDRTGLRHQKKDVILKNLHSLTASHPLPAPVFSGASLFWSQQVLKRLVLAGAVLPGAGMLLGLAAVKAQRNSLQEQF